SLVRHADADLTPTALIRILRVLAREAVAQERRRRRAMSGQHAEEEPDDRVRDNEPLSAPEGREGLEEVAEAEARADLLHVTDALFLGRGQDLADAEEADRHRHESDAREELDRAGVEPLRAGERVEDHRREAEAGRNQ